MIAEKFATWAFLRYDERRVEKLPAVNCLFHDVERAAEASFFKSCGL